MSISIHSNTCDCFVTIFIRLQFSNLKELTEKVDIWYPIKYKTK